MYPKIRLRPAAREYSPLEEKVQAFVSGGKGITPSPFIKGESAQMVDEKP